MLDLSELVFKANTTELKNAVTDIENVGKAMDNLSKISDRLSTSVDKAAKATKQSTDKISKANDDVSESAENTNRILERQQTILEYQAKGFSKGQASTIAYAKAVGATTTELEQLGKVLQTQRTLMGNDPFDKSLGSLRSLQNEYKVLRDVTRQYNSEVEISTKQMKDLALDKLRAIEVSKIEGKSLTDVKKTLRELNQEYIRTAQEVNRLKDAQAASDKQKRDSASANAYLAKELERVQFATAEVNGELNRSSSNALLKFERALKISGLTVDEQKAKLDSYRNALVQMDAASGKRNTDYISRAIGPQITDIVVGLSTGQSLMTVMLQQGGQLRDQFAMAGVAAGDMSTMMRTAAREMVSSVASVAKAFGGLFLGMFVDIGKGITNAIMGVTGLTAVMAKFNAVLEVSAATGNMFSLSLMAIGNMIPALVGGALAAGTAALIGLGVGLKQVIAEEDNLAKQLALSGGALNITTTEAIAYAKALDDGNISTGRAIEVISEMAKAGHLGKESIEIVTKAAVDMQLYAGVAIKDTVEAFAKMGEKPVESLLEVAKKTGMVSEETLKSVIALREQGMEADAAAAAIKAYGDVTTKQIDKMKQDYSDFSLFIKEVGRGISNFFADVFKDLWYKADPGTQMDNQLKKLNDRIEEVKGNLSKLGGFGDSSLLKSLEKERDVLSQQIDAYKRKATEQKEETERNVKNSKILQADYELREKYDDELIKAGKKKLSQEEYIAEKSKDILKDQAKKLGLNITDLEQNKELVKLAQDRAKLMYEQANKPKKAQETFSPVSDNTIPQLQKQYSSELVLAQNLSKDRLAVLKSEFESGKILRFEYMDKTNTALEQSEIAQLAVVEMYSDLMNDAISSRVDALQATYDKLSPKAKADPKVIEKFKADYDNLINTQITFNEQIDNTKEKIASAFDARSRENIALHEKAIFQITEAYREFQKAEELVAEQRKREKVLNEQLRWASPEQAAYIKATAAETERLVQAEKKLADAVKETTRQYEIAKQANVSPEVLKQALDEKLKAEEVYARAVAENSTKVQKAGIDAVIEYQRNQLAEFANGLADAVTTALFEGGKSGSKKLREVIVAELKKPVVLVVQAIVNALFGGISGSIGSSLLGNAAGSAGSSLLGNPLGSLTNLGGNFLGGGSFMGMMGNIGAGISNGFSTLLSEGIGAAVKQGFGLMGAGSTGGGLGTLLGGVGLPALAVAVIANGLGLFRKTKKVGGGLMGTLGQEGGIHNYDLMRRSGTLFSGPSYSYRDTGVSELDKQLQTSFLDSRKSIMDMTKALGLDATKLANFTTQLGSDIIHPDTGGRGIKLEGLTQEEAQKKINEALLTANDEMAQQILGTWETTTEKVSKTIMDFVDADTGTISRTIEETVTNTRYVASEYAKENEKAIDTLTRLATSITTVNGVFENLGVTLYETSLKGADAASKLIDAFGGLEEFAKATSTFYDKFYSDQEKYNNSQRELNALFAEYGLKLPKNKQEFRELVNAQDLSTESGRKVYTALMKVAGVFSDMSDLGDSLAEKEKQRIEEEQKQREEALKQLREAYIKQRKEALQAQIKITEDQINNLQKIFDLLTSEIKKLYGQVDSTAQMQIQQARQVINNAVASRTLPDAGTLQDAVGTITGGFDKTNYQSKVDADRDRLKFAAQLEDLRSIADKELKSAKNTFDLLKLQLAALDDIQVIDKKQLDSLNSIDGGVDKVVNAIYELPEALRDSIMGNIPTGTGGGSSTGGPTGTGGPLLITGGGSNPKVNYSAQEALTSFDKFQAWYKGIASNPANPMMNENYKVPDWLRVSGELGGRASTPEELFGRYLFFKNNPQYATDFENIFAGGTSQFSTSGKDLVKSDLSKMPTEVAEYFKNNTDSLLSYEGSGLDPVLGYQLYKYGPEYFGLDPRKNNFTDFLRNNKWTPQGIVANRNVIDYSNAEYAGGYKLSKYDTSTGNVVDINGQIYTRDGKLLGTASQALMEEIYGKDYIRNTGRQYGDTKRSALYNSNISAGFSEEHYYTELRKGLDKAITDGMTAQQLAYFMRDNGVSINDAAHAYGVSEEEIRRNLRNAGATDIPAFKYGGNYSGGVAMVGEDGPELINFNRGGYVHTASQSRDILSQADVVECLEIISNKIDQLEAAAISTAVSNNKISKILDRTTPDGNSINVKVVT